MERKRRRRNKKVFGLDTTRKLTVAGGKTGELSNGAMKQPQLTGADDFALEDSLISIDDEILDEIPLDSGIEESLAEDEGSGELIPEKTPEISIDELTELGTITSGEIFTDPFIDEIDLSEADDMEDRKDDSDFMESAGNEEIEDPDDFDDMESSEPSQPAGFLNLEILPEMPAVSGFDSEEIEQEPVSTLETPDLSDMFSESALEEDAFLRLAQEDDISEEPLQQPDITEPKTVVNVEEKFARDIEQTRMELDSIVMRLKELESLREKIHPQKISDNADEIPSAEGKAEEPAEEIQQKTEEPEKPETVLEPAENLPSEMPTEEKTEEMEEKADEPVLPEIHPEKTGEKNNENMANLPELPIPDLEEDTAPAVSEKKEKHKTDSMEIMVKAARYPLIQELETMEVLVKQEPSLFFLKDRIAKLKQSEDLSYKTISSLYRIVSNFMRESLEKMRKEAKTAVAGKTAPVKEPTESAESDTDTQVISRSALFLLREQYKKKKTAVAELEEQIERMKIDFTNLRQRQKKDIEIQIASFRESIILKILSVVDNFDRALSFARTANLSPDILKGFDLTYEDLMEMLRRYEISDIPAQGVRFDPFFHESLMIEDRDSTRDGEIVEEFRKGYMLGEKVIRPSQVKVARNESETDPGKYGILPEVSDILKQRNEEKEQTPVETKDRPAEEKKETVEKKEENIEITPFFGADMKRLEDLNISIGD